MIPQLVESTGAKPGIQGLTVKLSLDFQLQGGLVPQTLIFQGPDVVDPFYIYRKVAKTKYTESHTYPTPGFPLLLRS